MPTDSTPKTAFISYGQNDKRVADSVCAALEAEDVTCWIAPRDIAPGDTWANAIVDAINGAEVMVLILSEHSNRSPHVAREVDRAIHQKAPIFLFRTERLALSGELQYYLATHQYVDVDASSQPSEQHIPTLVRAIRRHLSGDSPIEPESGRKPVTLGRSKLGSPLKLAAAFVALAILIAAAWIFGPLGFQGNTDTALSFDSAPDFSLNAEGEVRLRIENTLETLLTDIRVFSPLPAGLRSASNTQTLEFFNGTLQAGEKLDLTAAVKASQAGSFTGTARVEIKGAGDARADWQIAVVQPDVAIVAGEPRIVAAGETFDHTLRITNQSAVPVTDAALLLKGLTGIELVSATPAPQSDAQATDPAWDLGTIEGEQSKTITLSLRSIDAGAARATFDLTGDQGRVSVREDLNITATPPNLTLALDGPARTTLCDLVTYRLTVSNRGSTTAHDVMIINDLPWQLITSDWRETAMYELEELPPGASQSYDLVTRPFRAGGYEHQALLTAVGLELESERVRTLVTDPADGSAGSLEISAKVPGVSSLGRSTPIEFVVRNPGARPLDKVIVRVAIPDGATFVSASDGGVLASPESVWWSLGTLQPGAATTVSLRTVSSRLGTFEFNCLAIAPCAEVGSASVALSYTGIPVMRLEAIAIENPVQVGEDATMLLTITNQGSAPDRDISVSVELPSELQLVSAQGATQGTASGRTLTFDVLPELAPKAMARWQIRTRATSRADVNVQFIVTSDDLKRPWKQSVYVRLYE
jgi:uncharacterized repeat protein (TIGR01451 family)